MTKINAQAAMTTGIGIDNLSQYVLARRYKLIDLAEQLQPTVVRRFVEFCDTHLHGFLNNCRGAEGILAQLSKEYDKMKGDQISELEKQIADLKAKVASLQSTVD
jgi:hypothetical protein